MKIDLFTHQKNGKDFILKNRGVGALYMEMGCGKTVTTLSIFEELRKDNPALKLIVISPLSLINGAWSEDVRKFTDFSFYNAHEKGLPILLKEDILAINYESMIQKKNKLLLPKLIQNNFLVIDESSRLKNHKAITTKTLHELRRFARYRVILSGTPAPNSPQEYWGQMEFLRESTLHKSFYAFRNTYFHLQRGQQVMNLAPGSFVTRNMMRDILTKGWKYEITSGNLKRMMEKISPLIFWAKKAECLDLPDQIDVIRKVEMSPAQKRHYKEMKEFLITEISGTPMTAPIALARLMKLREITSSFCINAEGKEVEIEGSPKLKDLIDVIEEAGDQQILIWANFKWEIKRIQSALFCHFPGSIINTLYSDTEDKDNSIFEFKTGKARFLIAHPQSAAHGLTFVNCSTQIFFSLSYSNEQHDQARGRIHRIGQNNKCTYVYILAKDSIDEDIYAALTKKTDMNQIIYNMIKK